MTRNILDEAHIHPAIRQTIADHHADAVSEVRAAVASNDVVVVGMTQNPFPKKARRRSTRQGFPTFDLRQLPWWLAASRRSQDVDRIADVSDGVRKRRTGRRCRRFEPAYCERRTNADAGWQARTPPKKVSEDDFR